MLACLTLSSAEPRTMQATTPIRTVLRSQGRHTSWETIASMSSGSRTRVRVPTSDQNMRISTVAAAKPARASKVAGRRQIAQMTSPTVEKPSRKCINSGEPALEDLRPRSAP